MLNLRIKYVALLFPIAGYASVPVVGSVTDLGTLKSDNTGNSYAAALSSDGTIVGGFSDNDDGYSRAAIWSGSNWSAKTDLGTLKGDNTGNAYVYGLSADGKVAVGQAQMDGGGSGSSVSVMAMSVSAYSSDAMHATVWSGSNWSVKSDLGTLKSDNSGDSTAYAVSSDGQVVVGTADNDAGNSQAIAWSGSNWSVKTDLGTLKSDNSGYSTAYAVSSNGSVITGESDDDAGDYRAIAWSGSNWSVRTDLGTLKSNNSGNSTAYAVSSNGSVIAGESDDDAGDYRAIVWSGSNWSVKTDLGTLKSDNSGNSAAIAVSSNGSVIAGVSDNDASYQRAVVWSGSNWSVKTDLGTLKSDNSGNSVARALSSDGTVAAGYADTDSSDGGQHAALWKIIYSTPAADPATAADPAAPVVSKVVAVDVTNTKRTVAQLSTDTFQVMDMQRQALLRLQNGCEADWKQTCWFARAGYTAGAGYSDTPTSFTMGYGVEQNLSLGFTLDHSLARSLPDSYKFSSNNIGVGIYAYWHVPTDSGEWYLRPSLAFNQYHVDIQRPELSFTEPGQGNGKMEGTAASLEGGQRFSLKNGTGLGWYTGLRYDNVNQIGYTESNAVFPLTYSEVNYRNTAIYAGFNTSVPVSDRVSWVSDVEIEQQLNSNDPEFSAHQQYMGSMMYSSGMVKTRGELESGVHYTPAKDITMEVMPSVAYSALGNTNWGVTVGIGGRF
ncbi:autotransporter domain-containing protein [[Enterobacter] lignolyticus]|uniref:Autotransporter domain-containing protein n=1 Tax=[Enterobacter] lignolyticus TaxID=1334193 RepID=A0A806XEG1_9ENTR|nr:autotransporter domain-containing protein [[Enterobacter] lignolyticus]ALR77179.1 hypothetical protein AO703_13005 [[Enterobacter] lignolyticus]